MTTYRGPIRAVAIAAVLCASALGAQAQEAAKTQYDVAADAAKKAVDALGIQLWGYMRAGGYYAQDGLPKGGYGAGYLGYNRLGNEGDNYFEFGIGKKWDMAGSKLGVYWMPYGYKGRSGGSSSGTKQIYADITGLSFAPKLTFWGGQRYHRIQDLHIIDQWLMQDGDNWGAGVDGIDMGGMGTLNVAGYTDDSTDGGGDSNGKRLNLQWRKIPLGPGGTLDLTAGYVRGNFGSKNNGFALGALWNQKFGDYTNSLFLQGSNGHADIDGKFYNTRGSSSTVNTIVNCVTNPIPNVACPASGLAIVPVTTTTAPGSAAKQFRVLDSLTWQSGPLGGQAFIGFHKVDPDQGPTSKNTGIGGRISYGFAPNMKFYFDANLGQLKVDGQSSMRSDKETIGLALAPKNDFWSRPEIRLYLTRVGGNSAFKNAQLNGKSQAILAGVQVEAWWE